MLWSKMSNGSSLRNSRDKRPSKWPSFVANVAKSQKPQANVLDKCYEQHAPSHIVIHYHNNWKHRIAQFQEMKKCRCFREVHYLDLKGSTRFIEILVFSMKGKNALITDPKIKIKQIPYLQEKYIEKFGGKEFSV